MIHFLMRVFKWPQNHSIYWTLEDARSSELALGQHMVYCHITRDANYVVDDMARWALEVRATITLWDRQVPEDALGTSYKMSTSSRV